MAVADAREAASEIFRRCSVWRPGESPYEVDPSEASAADGVLWFSVYAGPEAAEAVFEQISGRCGGLTMEMLEDLLDPDPRPQGTDYDQGRIRLASTFSVEARRREEEVRRGSPQRAGALIFQPVELLASDRWLITNWHPRQPFDGAERLEEGSRGNSDAAYQAVGAEWLDGSARTGGDLGVLVMKHLALSYKPAVRELQEWLDDWELSLYVEDDLSNPEELPHLWGSMAVLRDWLKALNRPGLRVDRAQAWLPVSDLGFVVDVDDLVDRNIDRLESLAETLRSSFSVLQVQLSDQERERREGVQRRVELIAAIFLVPTLIVGFYGANTWVPGEQKHWGFWVMVAFLVLISAAVVGALMWWQRRQEAQVQQETERRQRDHRELVRALCE